MLRSGININKFLVLIAGIVISLHTIIPHQQHSGCIENHSKTAGIEYPDQQQPITEDETNRCYVLDCYAFSDVIIKLNNDYSDFSIIDSDNFLFKIIYQMMISDVEKSNSIAYNSPSNIDLPDQYIISQVSLRGPPHFTKRNTPHFL